MEPRGLTGNTFVAIRKEIRLDSRFTTEELAAERPMSRLGRGVKLPEKLSELRQKLGQKAKQVRLIAHLKRRSQRPFRTPKGRTIHEHLKYLGLVNL